MPTARSFHFLTALRGIAAFGVLLFHFCDEFPALDNLLYWTRHYYIWVDLFFILSGFIMVHVYQDVLAVWNRGQYSDFLLKRIARIYPLHVITLGCMFLLELSNYIAHTLGIITMERPAFGIVAFSPASLLSNMFMMQAWGFHNAVTWNTPSWSISCEWAMYLLFPLLLRIQRCQFAGLATIVFSAALYYWLHNNAGNGSMDIYDNYALLRAFAGFTLGMALYGWHGWFIDHRTHAITAIIAAFIIMAAYSLLCWSDLSAIPLFCIMVIAGSALWHEIPQNFAGKSLVWLGDVSYSLYLWHAAFWLVASNIWKVIFHHEPGQGLGITASFIGLAATISIVLCIAGISYRYIEAPLRRTIYNRLRK